MSEQQAKSTLPAIVENSGLNLPGVYSRCGLELPENLDFDDWQNIGLKLATIQRATLWWWGDWLNYGERRYGEMYSQALDASEYEPQSLRAAKYVASRIELLSRLNNLSWSHHYEVAKFEPDLQDKWLRQAAEHGWSRKELRQQIKEYKLLTDARDRQRNGTNGKHEIIHADAVEFLNSLDDNSFDLLLTDPPYATDVDDIASFAASWVHLALSKIKAHGRAYIFTGPYPDELVAYIIEFNKFTAETGWTLDTPLVWTYRNAIGPDTKHKYKLNWQTCFHLYGPEAPSLNERELLKKFSVQEMNAPDARSGIRLHGWQKPDEIADRLILHSTTPGQIILDPFCGTGTFVAAACRLGCDAKACDASIEMLALCESRGLEVTNAV